MTISDLGQWISIFVMGGISLALGILSYLKNPKERQSLDGSSAKSYAEAARMAGEDRLKLEKELDEMKVEYDRRIAVLEHKKYRVSVEFEIGDPPSVGAVKVEPIVDISKINRKKQQPSVV